jgi:hypothetical protein
LGLCNACTEGAKGGIPVGRHTCLWACCSLRDRLLVAYVWGLCCTGGAIDIPSRRHACLWACPTYVWGLCNACTGGAKGGIIPVRRHTCLRACCLLRDRLLVAYVWGLCNACTEGAKGGIIPVRRHTCLRACCLLRDRLLVAYVWGYATHAPKVPKEASYRYAGIHAYGLAACYVTAFLSHTFGGYATHAPKVPKASYARVHAYGLGTYVWDMMHRRCQRRTLTHACMLTGLLLVT